MVKVVRGYYLVLDSFVIEEQSVLRSIALENVQVLNSELVVLVPPDSQALLTPRLPFLEASAVEQIKDFLIVDLQEGARHSDVLFFLELLGLLEDLSDASNSDSIVQVLRDHSFPSSLVLLRLLILVALHREGLA